jgi:thiol-disulfide isomerase/thioredoxin
MSDLIDHDRRRWLGMGAIGIAGARFGLYNPLMHLTTHSLRRPASEGQLASLRTATAWLNTPPLTEVNLSGKVVLIDVWTYTCINWLRTLPYIRAWADKYKAQGLVIIGVHSPEFPFEHDLENVRRAVKEMRVTYPVAVDNDFAIWRAFDNNYWPALYLLDGDGRARYQHFGEGAYDQIERNIQRLLKSAGARDVRSELVSVVPEGAEVAADWGNLKSPENYVGYGRTENFVSPGGAAVDERHVYAAPGRLRLNQWALSGEWTVSQGATALNKPNGRISYCFHARDVNLVMGPAVRGVPVRFRVRVDGQPPGATHGVDANEQGNGVVADQRVYQLIRQPKPIVDRQFEIEFLDPGVEAFSFTFG